VAVVIIAASAVHKTHTSSSLAISLIQWVVITDISSQDGMFDYITLNRHKYTSVIETDTQYVGK